MKKLNEGLVRISTLFRVDNLGTRLVPKLGISQSLAELIVISLLIPGGIVIGLLIGLVPLLAWGSIKSVVILGFFGFIFGTAWVGHTSSLTEEWGNK